MERLKTCMINNDEKDRLIKIISENSSKYGDKLIEFMNRNRIYGLRDATVSQLQYFVTKCLVKQQNVEKLF